MQWPWSKKVSPNARVHVADPPPARYSAPALRRFRLRPGMWVFDPGAGVGILTGLERDGTAQVMLVCEDGTNKLAISCPAEALRQALFEDIPACRRPAPEIALRMGYYMRNS